ncbi:General transcription factor IIH subunit 1, GTF2H1 [Carpediemonas membranifera]|uniref:General transcription factor IIH subunit 1, GTF2H1 n=1 Tax=Carpediemonas membranifera TaxID=201153 RepID=A0A8J6B067_9EUKA|nr:General transcription factor IIH subunit 1, GTF2H1 [Carpediemonas membranifera]|eukprot:KAG9391429.1 General transcription factor IIH subunit 1, GTF2H1 [Carpediemonas membranifera]
MLPLEKPGILHGTLPEGWNPNIIKIGTIPEKSRRQMAEGVQQNSACDPPAQAAKLNAYTDTIEALLKQFWDNYNSCISPLDPSFARIVAQLQRVQRRLQPLTESVAATRDNDLVNALLGPELDGQEEVVVSFATPMKERIQRVLDVYERLKTVVGARVSRPGVR